jgi:hypothetical protein
MAKMQNNLIAKIKMMDELWMGHEMDEKWFDLIWMNGQITHPIIKGQDWFQSCYCMHIGLKMDNHDWIPKWTFQIDCLNCFIGSNNFHECIGTTSLMVTHLD